MCLLSLHLHNKPVEIFMCLKSKQLKTRFGTHEFGHRIQIYVVVVVFFENENSVCCVYPAKTRVFTSALQDRLTARRVIHASVVLLKNIVFLIRHSRFPATL